MKQLIGLFVAGSLVCATGSAFAADIAAGKTKSTNCVGCHGVNGIAANPVYPNLAGQNIDYMVKQLKAFKDGSRTDPLMTTMVTVLSEKDMLNLAAYFNSMKGK